jgi:hypothetical protein
MGLNLYVGEPGVARLMGQLRGGPVYRVAHLEALMVDEHVTVRWTGTRGATCR